MLHKKTSLLSQNAFKFLFYLNLSSCIAISAIGQLGVGPVASSMGGAGVSSMDAVEAISLNPAGIANAKANYILLNFNLSEFDGLENRDWSLQALDAGKESLIKGAFQYHKSERKSESIRQSISRWELSGAKYVQAGLSFGASFTKQTFTDHKELTELVDYNLDLGSQFNISEKWGLGILVTDLFSGKDLRQTRKTTIGSIYRIGTKFRYMLDLRFQDQNNSERKWESLLGMELAVSEKVKWRFGYKNDDLNGSNYYTFGLSWQGPRLGIYYAHQNLTSKAAENLHNLDLRVFF